MKRCAPIFLREDSKHEECTSEYERRFEDVTVISRQEGAGENWLKNQHESKNKIKKKDTIN